LLLVVGTTLSFIFLDAPWRWLVVGLLAVIEIAEISLWLKMRSQRSVTGAEGIVGVTGRAINDCKPDGQVRVKGQVWKAYCAAGVSAGDEIVVTGMEGLSLQVSPR
jgi:membrane-bound serine protease (ClpP class)